MKFWFCEKCGTRITDDDLAGGKAAETEAHGVCCSACLNGGLKRAGSSSRNIQPPRRTTTMIPVRPSVRGTGSPSMPAWPYYTGALALALFGLGAAFLTRARPEPAQIVVMSNDNESSRLAVSEPARAADTPSAPAPPPPAASAAPVVADAPPRRDEKVGGGSLFSLQFGGNETSAPHSGTSPRPAQRKMDPARPVSPNASEDLEGLMQRALEMERNGDMPGALAAYDKGIKLSPNYAEIYSNRGNIKLSMSDFQGALADADAALALKNFWNAWAVKAIACAALGKEEDYNAAVDQAVLVAPQKAQIAALIDASAKKVKRETAGQSLEGKQPQTSEEFLARAQFRLKQKHFREALSDYESAVERDAGLVEKGIYAAMAELAGQEGDNRGKLEYYQKWLKAQPAHPEALNAVAWELLTSKDESLRNPTAALPLAEKANSLTQGRNPGIMDTYAMALFQSGRKTDAIAAQKKALALLPKETPTQVRQEFEQHLHTIED